MTAYAASLSFGATSMVLNIKPSSTYQIRIARVEFSGFVAASITDGQVLSYSYGVSVAPSATLSGGSTATPVSMRQGAPAASATVKSGGTVTGTYFALHSEGNASVAPSGTTSGSTAIIAQLNSSYSTPFDLILSNGSVFTVSGSASVFAGMTIVVYFEELRLGWSS